MDETLRKQTGIYILTMLGFGIFLLLAWVNTIVVNPFILLFLDGITGASYAYAAILIRYWFKVPKEEVPELPILPNNSD